MHVQFIKQSLRLKQIEGEKNELETSLGQLRIANQELASVKQQLEADNHVLEG